MNPSVSEMIGSEPEVVIAPRDVYLGAAFPERRERVEDVAVVSRHDAAVFEPEIEDVSEEVEPRRSLDPGEEGDEAIALHALVGLPSRRI